MYSSNYVLGVCYKIYEISPDGLLKEPRDKYGALIFSWMDFKTEKDAELAILNSQDVQYSDNLVVIKNVKKIN